MKIYYPLLFLSFLVIALAAPLRAQHAFDTKKKKKASVNTTSLGAVSINGAATQFTAGRTKATLPSIIQPGLLFSQPQKVFYSRETGLPSFITSKRTNSSARVAIKRDSHTDAFEYLLELKPLLQLENPEGNFVVRNVHIDNTSKTHVRLDQHYKGIPVYAGEVIVHLNELGEGESFNGTYYKITENINPVPAISAQSAIEKVSAHLGKGTPLRPLTTLEKRLVQHEQPHATLCVYQAKGLVKRHLLAYHVVYCPTVQERWEYFVDASTGTVIHRFESICSVDGPATATGTDLNGISRTVNTYQKGTAFFMVDISRAMYKAVGSTLPDEPIGGILTVDMNNTFGAAQSVQHATSTNNVWSTANQTKALSAQFNAGIAYEYYLTKHSRNSIDGAGSTIISIINVPDETGLGLDNAYWNGKAIFYGNGNAAFKPLAGAIDVAGHEMTHGVVQSTANLEYQGESGAINESMADVFGSMMDPADWLIGEDVVKPGAFPSGALRSMSDPHNGGTSFSSPGYQPKHKSEAYTGTEDNGGVHINSGIPNHAFYKYAQAITPDKAAAVFYKALTDYLTKSSQFVDLRLAVVKAASDLYGAASNEVTQAGLAFDAVGIVNGQAGVYTETLPDNPGTEFLLVNNTNVTNANTLYRTSLDGATQTALTTTGFSSKPSITDNGEITVFVAANKTIHVISTAPESPPNEKVLQADPIWSNVVVSKGGTKIAAVTIAQNPSIHVYDFASAKWAEFKLYNPTYTKGVNSAGPVYADALEWDYSGEFLVYDCFNRLVNIDGLDIEYWDVNFIHVWNNTAGTFADGAIEKLFPILPDNVSIGNPSFAKKSPNILAFDYVDAGTGQYAILGCNVETNDVQVIATNTTLGWPSFNKSDSHVAFTTLHGSTDYKTSYVVLNTDKISSSTAPVDMFLSTKWPLYFAAGTRIIGKEVITGLLDEPTTSSETVSCYPNPFIDEVSVLLQEGLLAGRVEVINSMGQQVYEGDGKSSSHGSLQINLANLNTGYYFLRVFNAKKMGSCKLLKK
jgi:bacillolysin